MGTNEEFQELTRARDILVDPVARVRYDETGKIDEDSTIDELLGAEDFLHVFGDCLGPARGLDKHFDVYVNKSEADEDVVMYIWLKRMVRCKHCATGQSFRKIECSRCLGQKIEITKDVKDENGRSIELCSSVCRGCSGVGYIGLGDNCKSCNGNKLESTFEKVRVPLLRGDIKEFPHMVFRELSDEPIDPTAVPGDVCLHFQHSGSFFGSFYKTQREEFSYVLYPCSFKIEPSHYVILMTESYYQSWIEDRGSSNYHGFELPEEKASREQNQAVSASSSKEDKAAATSRFRWSWIPCVNSREVVSPRLEPVEDEDISNVSSESFEERPGESGVRIDQIQHTSNDMSEIQERFVQFLC
eukprot:TRINITY_DN928_c0_g2_i1.p1 TRINITY_DN928_c0_g2~~TRINITY_DN928_c0_g2_i1.p1  ORF type:complete len:405 (-),score=88.61 TRINITY_DN928_c0_g2_i1:63-1136(-)